MHPMACRAARLYAKFFMIVSEDVLVMMIDSDWSGTIGRLRSSADLLGLSLAMAYGIGLPQGREWGARDQRAQWLHSERAKAVRQYAMLAAKSLLTSDSDLMRFVRLCKRSRAYGGTLKRLVKIWHQEHDVASMEIT